MKSYVRSWKNHNSDEKMNTGISDTQYYFQMRCLCKWYHYKAKKSKFDSGWVNNVSTTVALKIWKTIGVCTSRICPMTTEEIL